MHLDARRRLSILIPAMLAMVGVRADLLELQNGFLEGDILEDTETIYRVRTKNSTLDVPKSKVTAVYPGKTLRDLYREKWIELASDDIRGRLSLAEWCQKNGMEEESEEEYRHVLELDPNNRVARQRLGYEKVDGQWVPSKEVKAARGLVLHKGRWVKPEDRDRDTERRDRLRAQNVVHDIFLRMRNHPEERQKLLETLLAEDGTYASLYVLAYLPPARERNPALREGAAAALGKFKAKAAVQALAKSAIHDPDEDVRRQAAVSLGQIGGDETVRAVVPQLASREKTVRTRSAQALGTMRNPKAIPALIEALYLKIVVNYVPDPQEMEEKNSPGIRTEVLPGGQTLTTINPVINRYQSLVTLGAASDRKGPDVTFDTNEAAHEALKTLTGQDFEFDKNKWRSWWAAHQDDLMSKP